MFDPSIYMARRAALAHALPGALILLPGNAEAPIDFAANSYPFRQDSSFRYFFGIDRPGLVGLIDASEDEHWLFGDEPGSNATIWLGARPALARQAQGVAVARTGTRADLSARLQKARRLGRAILYPPPYRAETLLTLSTLLDVTPAIIAAGASPVLVDAIVPLREIKGAEEIAELTAALAVTRRMHHIAMAATRPGISEHAVMGRIEGAARGADLRLAYQPIFSIRGEVLHNMRYNNSMRAGDLVVHDSGATSAGGYSSDVTRTLPVSGRFDPLQRRLYDAVLRAQQEAIAACRPGVRFLDIHLGAARVLAAELTDLGLFRGDPAAVVASGAYALCFQCGLGHQIGLDVHDMEALGEDRVGYDAETSRSAIFGLRSLRLGKRLKAGMTLTVEPGLYFIPAQIDLWRAEGRHLDSIDYDRFEAFRRFGGIRIEDEVLVTAGGATVLGEPIARDAEDVEARMGTAGPHMG